MLASGVDCPVRELDRKGSIPVGTGERAFVQDVERTTFVRFLPGNPDPMVPEPGSKIQRLAASLAPMRGIGRGGGEGRSQPLQELFRHNRSLARDRDQAGPPVWPVRGVVPLPAHRPVQLPDPCSVVVRRVDRGRSVIKHGSQDLETSLHQVPGPVIIRQVDLIDEMSPVPRISDDWVRPSQLSQVFRHPGCRINRCLVLLVSRGDTRWSSRVHIDREPATVQDIRIRRCRILLREPGLDPVRPPREKGRIHLV
ncbi:MAG: hypothetical protein BWY93_01239 [Euryarchaeota archaeon ADurb.BinA087]|nr:MAG: hypothetical protein BWY93_01239 [Euryarchaeota archaeon ADurb.BinA087]